MSEAHFCATHNTVWFKKGNMRGYAHPIKDGAGNTIGWCNEPAQQATASPAPVAPAPPPEPDKRQSSIEAQNALTNLTNLMAANMLTLEYIDAMSPLEGALVSTLMTRAGINLAFAEKREPIPANQLRPPRNPVG